MEWRYQVKDDSRLGKVLQMLREEAVGPSAKEQAERILCAFLLPIACYNSETINDPQIRAMVLESIHILEMQAMKIRRLYNVSYDTLPVPGATGPATNQSTPQRSMIPKAIPPALANEVSQEELAHYFNHFNRP